MRELLPTSLYFYLSALKLESIVYYLHRACLDCYPSLIYDDDDGAWGSLS